MSQQQQQRPLKPRKDHSRMKGAVHSYLLQNVGRYLHYREIWQNIPDPYRNSFHPELENNPTRRFQYLQNTINSWSKVSPIRRSAGGYYGIFADDIKFSPVRRESVPPSAHAPGSRRSKSPRASPPRYPGDSAHGHAHAHAHARAHSHGTDTTHATHDYLAQPMFTSPEWIASPPSSPSTSPTLPSISTLLDTIHTDASRESSPPHEHEHGGEGDFRSSASVHSCTSSAFSYASSTSSTSSASTSTSTSSSLQSYPHAHTHTYPHSHAHYKSPAALRLSIAHLVA
ncbi:hypothetical protein M427DRAFT_152198 [Gonapodya prolifera JEL478]|uniref:Uncharacterized protein n=1 Tax=Gonapodya prolifera (strain JEL478) TaxID=1344416 RepID=A0A139ASF5_GONPJ|nr:hypothetical protein M427DRAFT_152198 [Gonapodya prolifera JEL478]|eukprot:KXS19676.1 hypothetical protein M427DRAFT_152198 [Gonapodya prolifera JEL478]